MAGGCLLSEVWEECEAGRLAGTGRRAGVLLAAAVGDDVCVCWCVHVCSFLFAYINSGCMKESK